MTEGELRLRRNRAEQRLADNLAEEKTLFRMRESVRAGIRQVQRRKYYYRQSLHLLHIVAKGKRKARRQ
jgi:hypothetical protein